jgi:hypothetical protein
MNIIKKLIICLLFTSFTFLKAQERNNEFQFEAGVLYTQNMVMHGFNQANATKGWSKESPDVRFEYWSKKDNSWNYGLIFQPLSVNYSGVLSSNLNYKGIVYKAGDAGHLKYQFPTLRFSSNYPIFSSNSGKEFLRFGASIVVRYADINLSTNTNSFNTTNLLALPLINLEANKTLSNDYSLFTRADFLPSIDGSTFLDGLFDIFIGIKKIMNPKSNIDIGLRMFFGGYNPRKADDFANRIFYNAFVVRYSWN